MWRAVQLALAGLSAVAVAYGFARYGYGLFVPVFRREFGLSTAEIGLISSGAYASYLFAMLSTGFFVGRVGPRLPVVAGALCAGCGMLLIAASEGATTLAAGAILAGSSSGFCWAPFSDAVAMLVQKEDRDRVLSVISTGTTFGLTVAGPVVILISYVAEGAGWRYAWVFFAVAAFVVAVWNLRLLPSEPYRKPAGAEVDEKPNLSWFINSESAPLLGQAFCYGLVASFYYTYAVDLLQQWGLSEVWGPVLWSLIGVAGITGILSGDAVSHFGLKSSLVTCLLALGLSIGILNLASGSSLLVVGGALLFGASYMPVAALLALWSSNVFHEKPATGFSVVLLALAVGSIVGPAALGTLADASSTKAAFWCASIITVLSSLLTPASNVRGTTHVETDSRDQS